MKGGAILAIVVVALFGMWGCSQYNGLVTTDSEVQTAWANVQSAYQRRADLVPNLVSTVKGAANFEQQTLTQVVEARAKATSIQLKAEDLNDPQKMQQFQQAQASLSQGLGRLMMVAENYPQLRATEAFVGLQSQLEGTENRINTERNRYNEVVQRYNVKVRSFPLVMFAGMMGFSAKQPFQADASAQNAPKVQF
ncbi:MAG TPA: LemA family protein [Bacteroidetes bacterium]|nr:LemA family protein [Bacteroidota bacterium]HRR10259.1 LemA family protein [Rhodothermales bacterium]